MNPLLRASAGGGEGFHDRLTLTSSRYSTGLLNIGSNAKLMGQQELNDIIKHLSSMT